MIEKKIDFIKSTDYKLIIDLLGDSFSYLKDSKFLEKDFCCGVEKKCVWARGDDTSMLNKFERFIKSLFEVKSELWSLDLIEDLAFLYLNKNGIVHKPYNFIIKDWQKKDIVAKNKSQIDLFNSILNNQITIVNGPAGGGKTFISVATAIRLLLRGSYKKIVISRPIVEAWENLGFLPGSLENKVDPFLRPIYDAMEDILGLDKFKKMLENKTIEISPLAYMRGRTFNDSVILLDEAQNCNYEQIKMFLTRIGNNSKMIITGDITQKDLNRNIESGLSIIVNYLNTVEDINVINISENDLVRNPIIVYILNALRCYEES